MSDFPNNLEAQSRLIAAILQTLMKSGIAKSALAVSMFKNDFTSVGYPEGFDSDGLFEDLLAWLKAEDIVRYDNVVGGDANQSVYLGSVLTAKGLARLQTKSDVLGGQTPAEFISQKGGLTAPMYAKWGAFLGGFAGGFAKSAGG